MITRSLATIFGGIALVMSRATRVMERLAGRFGSTEELRRNRAIIKSTQTHNMATHPDEDYYRCLYWCWIEPHLKGLPNSARCLDLGCGQGRLSLPLADQFGRGTVVGVDLSASAIAEAARNAATNGRANVKFICQPLDQYISQLPSACFNLIVFTEVSFFWPQWRTHFTRLVEALLPGGLLIASFRPQYFNALCLVQQRRWKELKVVLEEREGKIFGPDVGFSWQTSKEIANLFTRENGLELELITGVGVCSGIEGDPHYGVVNPSALSLSEQQHLQATEISLGKEVPDAGRYMLAVGRKC